jgi:hypothetical protein
MGGAFNGLVLVEFLVLFLVLTAIVGGWVKEGWEGK